MTFELDPATIAARDAAAACAASTLVPDAATIDRDGAVPHAVREAARRALAAPAGGVAWCLTVEVLAAASPAAALTAAADALGTSSPGGTQWTGLRGFDVDGVGVALRASTPWQLAVTAVIVGVGRAAVAAATAALKAEKAAGRPVDAAGPALADAATALEATRLLLWEAAAVGERAEAVAARALARLQALDALPLALNAAVAAAGHESVRPGRPLERARRDAATLVDVLGDAAAAQADAAAGVLPA